jgi:hypothetical protein
MIVRRLQDKRGHDPGVQEVGYDGQDIHKINALWFGADSSAAASM